MNESTKLVYDKLAETISDMADEPNAKTRYSLGMKAATLLGELAFALVAVSELTKTEGTDDSVGHRNGAAA